MDNPPSASSSRLAETINGLVIGAARHWTALVNGAVAFYIAVAVSAPLLMMAGLEGPASAIYFIFRITCHQLPQRSFFLGGPSLAYSFEQVAAVTGAIDRLELFWRPIYDKALGLGYQIAFCQRDTAIYLAILITGLAFALSGRRWRPLPWYGLVLLAIPIALDGFSQLPGWRESTPWLRVLTGALFGAGAVWFAYPHLNQAMRDVARSLPRND